MTLRLATEIELRADLKLAAGVDAFTVSRGRSIPELRLSLAFQNGIGYIRIALMDGPVVLLFTDQPADELALMVNTMAQLASRLGKD